MIRILNGKEVKEWPRSGPPPMPIGFDDRTAWDAIHWKFAGNGCLLDQAVMAWQRENQERVKAAAAAARAAELGGK